VNQGTEEENKKRVTIALEDRHDSGREKLRAFSKAVQKRLSADHAMVKPEAFPGPDEDRVYVDIDRRNSPKPNGKTKSSPTASRRRI
jgi:hypothetical protein